MLKFQSAVLAGAVALASLSGAALAGEGDHGSNDSVAVRLRGDVWYGYLTQGGPQYDEIGLKLGLSGDISPTIGYDIDILSKMQFGGPSFTSLTGALVYHLDDNRRLEIGAPRSAMSRLSPGFRITSNPALSDMVFPEFRYSLFEYFQTQPFFTPLGVAYYARSGDARYGFSAHALTSGGPVFLTAGYATKLGSGTRVAAGIEYLPEVQNVFVRAQARGQLSDNLRYRLGGFYETNGPDRFAGLILGGSYRLSDATRVSLTSTTTWQDGIMDISHITADIDWRLNKLGGFGSFSGPFSGFGGEDDDCDGPTFNLGLTTSLDAVSDPLISALVKYRF